MTEDLELSRGGECGLESGEYPVQALIEQAVQKAIDAVNEELFTLRKRIQVLEEELDRQRTRAFLQTFSQWLDTEEGKSASESLLSQGVDEDELPSALMRVFKESVPV